MGDEVKQETVPCGQLHCQKDSYSKTLLTSVHSCRPSSVKADKGKAWEVRLRDTVLFPEGGGQPWDLGLVGGQEVLRVVNVDGQAVHFLKGPLEEGAEVEVCVDWVRRQDLMHQHSAQHLITALAIDMFGYETLTWDLKPNDAASTTLDLGTEELPAAQFDDLERRVNAAIGEERPVTPRWIAADAPEVEQIRCRGLPEGLKGPYRVLEMEGIDTNLCCGTHVKNTGHLRQIKLLSTERVRDRGKTHVRLHFVAGDRVLRMLASTFRREAHIGSLLTAPPDKQVEFVEALLAAKKEKAREAKALMAEVVELTVARLRARAEGGERVLEVHREFGDMDAMRDLATALDSTGALLLTTFGGPGPGTFMLSGPAEKVAELGPQVAQVLKGRGGGGKGRFQGKAEKLAARGEALALLREALENKE